MLLRHHLKSGWRVSATVSPIGAGIEDREHHSYPYQLGELLGPTWDVRNFGVNGATLLKKGDKPYWDQPTYKEALSFNPNVVIIKLGTNDTKPQNWKYSRNYFADYVTLINSFKKLPTHPKIYICLPVPAYGTRWGISENVIKNEVIPQVRRISRDTGVTLIDLYHPLSGKETLFPDKIHPDAKGAGIMAQVIYRFVEKS